MKINQTKKIKNKEKLKISLLKKPNKITSSRTLIKNKIKEKLKINIVNKKLKKRTITNSNYKKYFRSFKKNSFIKKTLGIGIYKISSFFKEAGLNLRLKIIKQKLSLLKKVKIMVNKNTFNNELWSKLQSILTFYINLRNYKGIRHRYKYPVRGQRTHTNAKTRKKQNKKIKSIIKYDKKGKKTNKITINKQSKKTSKKL